MATVRDLINAALLDIGALGIGEAASANEQTDALNALNNLVDSWSNESLIVVSRVIESFPLVSGQQTYTMGASGNFNTARPQRIEQIGLVVPATYPVEIPIDIVTKDEWAMIGVKTVTSSIPIKMYSDGNYPLTNLYFWPVPSGAGNTVTIYSWKPIGAFASANVTVSLPPGYFRALQKGLAIELAPGFGKEIGPVLVAQYKEAKANIKRMNTQPMYLGCDDGLLAERPGFNWMTGDTNR